MLSSFINYFYPRRGGSRLFEREKIMKTKKPEKKEPTRPILIFLPEKWWKQTDARPRNVRYLDVFTNGLEYLHLRKNGKTHKEIIEAKNSEYLTDF